MSSIKLTRHSRNKGSLGRMGERMKDIGTLALCGIIYLVTGTVCIAIIMLAWQLVGPRP